MSFLHLAMGAWVWVLTLKTAEKSVLTSFWMRAAPESWSKNTTTTVVIVYPLSTMTVDLIHLITGCIRNGPILMVLIPITPHFFHAYVFCFKVPMRSQASAWV